MAVLDKSLKQRIVGALVLVALAVIFLPMLFSRPDDLRQVVVDAPPMPPAPAMVPVTQEPVVVPEPEPLPEDPAASAQALVAPPPVAAPATAAAPAQADPGNAPASHLDRNSLPVTWSVQLASLASLSSAQDLQQKLRSKGYNAYVRSFEGKNRVLVGPVVERAEADRLRDQLKRQQKLDGFIVRFEPEAQ
ncbi:SPOR domain-containing protein [Pseudomonas sp. N040]|uniref:SPOR domain-containing protein n=1 Tax=Pseudomonas sp. N040 TaxID=2785325 RepID=UPI0018A2545C|nr:SPOR domain-containing protein [Pseudomonas sp. N040]MBF7729175.1 SPOR domain-containing protein [Pseudomonas sp. N040]MBW7012815.1 SPOR domain-containing protein [Pseudomonas sp. N040]